MMFGMGFGALFFWLIVVGLLAWGFNRVVSANRSRQNDRYLRQYEETLEILKKRYASGEISKEQFEEMKRTITND